MSAKTTLKALSIVLVFSLLFSFVGCASKTNLCGHLTEDDKARLQEVIEGINGFYATDPSAMIIIEEEVPGYFLGQKTVDDVVAIIQSRSETVVQERG